MADETFAPEMGDEFSSGKKSAGKLSLKLEGIIPIIIIVIVVLLIVFKTNLIASGASLFKTGGVSVLVVGSPYPDFKSVLTDQEAKDIIKEVRFVTVESIQHNPKERIKGYDVIILDQSLSSDKSITRTLGEAIADYVKTGGRLIVVLNSGIERPGDPSVVGWKATFGNIVPVSCDPTLYSSPSCKNTLHISGILYAIKEDHPIMQGIEKVPALESAGLLQTETYDVGVTGTEIAYLEDARSKKTYPAIVEAPLLLGKVIYFNYDPALSKAIFYNTMKYLR